MLLLATGLLAATAAAAHAPDPRLARDPDRAPISVSDVTLFWRAYDAWVAAGADSAKLAAVLKTEYLDKASDGVKDFTPNRIVDAESLAARILDDRGYYERARPYSSQSSPSNPKFAPSTVSSATGTPRRAFPPSTLLSAAATPAA